MIPLMIAAAGVYGYATQVRAGKHDVTVASAPSPLQCGETTLTAHEIYRRVRGGPGSSSLVRADAAARFLATRYEFRHDQLSDLQRRMADAWQGDASDGAHRHLAPLFTALRESHDLLSRTAAPLRAQAESFDHAYKHVEPVPTEPPSSNLLNDAIPFHTDTDRKIDEYNAKASKNVQIYGEYNTASHANSTAVPQSYPTLPPPAADLQVEVRASTNGSTGTGMSPGASPGVPGGGSAFSATTPGQGGVPSAPPVNTVPSPTAHPAPVPSAGTTPQDWVPAATTAPPVSATPVAGPGTPAPGGGLVAGPFVGADGRAGGPGGRYGEAGRPGTGNGPRTGGAPVTRGLPPVTPAAAGGRGGGLGGGPGGVGPVGAGRKQDGEDDLEHKNKYLTSPDKDEMFGVDQVCAPPVIGERR